jgi:hypothetical protein
MFAWLKKLGNLLTTDLRQGILIKPSDPAPVAENKDSHNKVLATPAPSTKAKKPRARRNGPKKPKA